MKDQFIKWLNRFLVFDVFLVIFGFFWFAIAVLARSIGVDFGFDLWYKLWQPLFNPAIGILFLGAFVSWGVNKISERFKAN
ncbi:hypothetical protein [Gloeothece verrucosa]|uniref:Uncharacterized protein n=1 Tax=Gloeothece verrucosa (strain PCC 7822) TaxID=497965 RepID=E0U5Y7_GLOV7|nr:hypothetical protein [Gloeothece verrucosa]ADN17096.1 conserved hypothetical protein [Gloeothece verrucosa PCC 7822]